MKEVQVRTWKFEKAWHYQVNAVVGRFVQSVRGYIDSIMGAKSDGLYLIELPEVSTTVKSVLIGILLNPPISIFMLLAISTPHLDLNFKCSLFGTYKVRSCGTSLMNGTREVRVQA